jgi:hypothetical protein
MLGFFLDSSAFATIIETYSQPFPNETASVATKLRGTLLEKCAYPFLIIVTVVDLAAESLYPLVSLWNERMGVCQGANLLLQNSVH